MEMNSRQLTVESRVDGIEDTLRSLKVTSQSIGDQRGAGHSVVYNDQIEVNPCCPRICSCTEVIQSNGQPSLTQ